MAEGAQLLVHPQEGAQPALIIEAQGFYVQAKTAPHHPRDACVRDAEVFLRIRQFDKEREMHTWFDESIASDSDPLSG
jgi:hypothetical protein